MPKKAVYGIDTTVEENGIAAAKSYLLPRAGGRQMRRSSPFFLVLLVAVMAIAWSASDEERLTRLFDNAFDFWDGDWSPDGQRLALAGKQHYQPGDKSRIWLYTAGRDKPVLWTNTDTYCDDWPRWSPDGRQIALVRQDLGEGRRTCIWWKDVATGAGRRLTKGPDDRQPSWSPNGQSLVFRRGLGPAESALAVFEAASGKVSQLPIPRGLLGEPFWGRDGFIYYTRYRLVTRETKVNGQIYRVQVIGDGSLWRYQPATGEEGAILPAGPDQRMPALSPDGKHLAFYAQRDGLGQVLSIPDPTCWALFLREQATGKLTEIVANVALTGGPPIWSRDGSSITFYSLRKKVPALWSCPLAPPAEAGS